jgi:hypothetical protein
MKVDPGDASAGRWLTFVHFDLFTAAWAALGLTDDHLAELEALIVSGPTRAPVVARAGGLRKLRFAPRQWPKGKSGGVRVGYAYYPKHEAVALVTAYGKTDKANLSRDEEHAIRTLLDRFGRLLDDGWLVANLRRTGRPRP